MTALTAGLEPQFAQLGDITLRYVATGDGPLVLLLHGFPQYLHCWRHQLPALAAAGYRAVAVDLRGYGGSSAPSDPRAYSQLHLAGDVVGLIESLGYEDSVLVGHDMGAHLAWAMSTLVPDRVGGLVAMSVPLRARSERPPLAVARETLGEDFYQVRFQIPDAPERDLDSHVETFLPGIFDGLSGGTDHPVTSLVVPPDESFSDLFGAPAQLPSWLPAEDLAAYVATFQASGFAGSVHWYRNLDANWELTAAWTGDVVRVPTLYLAGDRDIAYVGAARTGVLDALPKLVPGLREVRVVPECGHWTMEERPDEVNRALVGFLGDIGRRPGS